MLTANDELRLPLLLNVSTDADSQSDSNRPIETLTTPAKTICSRPKLPTTGANSDCSFARSSNELMTPTDTFAGVRLAGADGRQLTLNEAVRLARDYRAKPCQDGRRLHEVFQDCEIVLGEVVEPARTPEYDERIRQLRIQQENAHYQEMVADIDGSMASSRDTLNLGAEVKKINRKLTVIINVILTVVGAAVFAYLAAGIFLSNTDHRILAAFLVGFVVLFADIYFIITRLV